MNPYIRRYRIHAYVDSTTDSLHYGLEFLPILKTPFTVNHTSLGLYQHSIGFLLSWSTMSPDTAHIPFSEWPMVVPEIDIG